MVINKIVAATDFSETSLVAVETAFRLAQESDATLYLVHALNVPVIEHPLGAFHPVMQELYNGALKRLRSLIPKNWEGPSKIETVVLKQVHSPAATIAKFALEHGADMIVVGTHGRTGLDRLLLGSTAERLLREAPCQVLVVKHKVSRETPRSEPAGTACEP